MPVVLVLALALSSAATAPAQDSQALARTSQVTDAKEQLDFGVRMARRGLWSEALFRFKQARRLDPGNARVLNNMAVAYEALGQFDNALETYQEAIRIQSTDRDLRKNYSRFVEFYRAFRPDDQKDASLEDSETSTEQAANDNEPVAEPADGESGSGQ
ncbi:MAG: tetratricopeptide repeat protein [Thermoanaerobaculia bacterium]|nr:tetratricopeptide repeat protein [Thermoanaerobaculia bacterium]